MKKYLLKALLKNINKNWNREKGILRIRLKEEFFGETDKGFVVAKELYYLDKFESFVREYCMYLGFVETILGENHDAEYEIIWDYKTYFEQQRYLCNNNSKDNNLLLVKKS